MTVEKKPFVSYTLDEDKVEADSKPLVIRINKAERQLIDEIKDIMHYANDSKVIKIGLVLLRNVIHSTFGEVLMSKITSEERRKPVVEAAKKTEFG
jgi:hypothetical protein